MNTTKRVLVTLMLFVFLGNSLPVQAQQRVGRTSDARIENIIRSLETNTDSYRESLDNALDTSRLDGTNAEDEINRYVREFEEATDALRQNFNARRTVNADVQEVFNRAINIDDFMRRNRLTPRAERDWALVRADLNRLGRNYNIAYRRNGNGNTFPRNTNDDGFGGSTSGSEDSRLTGTYRLDTRRSDDPRAQATAATRNLPLNQRQRVYNNLLSRLESPAELALERRGRNVTIGSTRATQVTIEATGREEVERYDNGRLSRVRADIVGDRLTITSSNDNNNNNARINDRTNDYIVAFESLDGGRQLRVTRTVYADRLQQAVVVRSIYDRVSPTARYDIYRPDNFPRQDTQVGTTTSSGFIVPDGTAVVAILDTDLSTRNVNDRDRFTMTVRDPGQYDGARIEGYVSDVSRSGRIKGRSGLTLNFERIILRNGRSYNFAGAVESVRARGSNEDVRVDNEGTVREEGSQTERTVQRAAIGTAIGALIGAIAGGGKGAAIGAVVGAGAGAGSVYAQGRDDLDLVSGTEFTVRASAPR